MKPIVNVAALMVITAALCLLSGCNAVGTAIKKRHLEVKTQMSDTVWLTPSAEKTVYLHIKNTADKPLPGLALSITQALEEKGYRLTPNADSAHYWVRVNVLKADRMDLRDAEGMLSRGYEGALAGAALGAGISAYNGSGGGGILAVGLASGLLGMATDAMVEDVNITMVTDIQIVEKAHTTGAPIMHQTRVVSNANQVNLTYEVAQPVLEAQLAKTIVNIL